MRKIAHVVLLSATLASGRLFLGCTSAAKQSEPLHTHLVCASGAAGSEGCGALERRREFDSWADEAIRRAFSTFTLWIAGSDRHSYRAVFVACVPASWGAGVMEAKAAFVRAARQQVATAGTPQTPLVVLPDGCVPAAASAAGAHRLRVMRDADGSSAVWQSIAAFSPERLNTAVVCDRSDSGLGVTCTAAELLRSYERWIAAGRGASGGTFTVYLVGTSRDTVRRVFAVSVPDLPLGEKAAFLLGAREELGRALATDAVHNASAIAEAVHVAASELRDASGRRELELLSDLRQFTAGQWNFERSVPEVPAFARWLQRQGLLADLHGVPVRVCGLHHRRAPSAGPFDARLATKVRQIWEATFQAMGVSELHLVQTCEASAGAAL